jgi:hypothetical protein
MAGAQKILLRNAPGVVAELRVLRVGPELGQGCFCLYLHRDTAQVSKQHKQVRWARLTAAPVVCPVRKHSGALMQALSVPFFLDLPFPAVHACSSPVHGGFQRPGALGLVHIDRVFTERFPGQGVGAGAPCAPAGAGCASTMRSPTGLRQVGSGLVLRSVPEA